MSAFDQKRPSAWAKHFELSAEVLRLGSRVASTRMKFYGADGKLMSSADGAYILRLSLRTPDHSPGQARAQFTVDPGSSRG